MIGESKTEGTTRISKTKKKFEEDNETLDSMASKKKESEGIALLSMYDDDEEEEEDVEMEDVPENNQQPNNHNNQEEEKQELQDSVVPETTPYVPPQSQNSIPTEEEEVEDLEERVSTPFYSPSPSQLPLPLPPPPTFEPQLPRKRSLAIVDYAHDETAMSPEPEEGEITGSGEDPQSTDDKSPPVHTFIPNVRGTPQPSEQPERLLSDNNTIATCVGMETETVVIEETVTMSVQVQKAEDPLDNFLPPPPEAMCPKELQDKINKFLAYKKAGKSFNAEVRNRKDYRNPDFLLHAVRYQDIDQIGSCFNKEVFDPHGYDKSDFYDELEADMKREMERKEQERKKSQRLDFVSGGTQAVGVPAAQKNTIQNPVLAVPTAASTGFQSHPVPADSVARENRQNKKSKWDKVDGDRKNPLPITGQDALSTAAAHAALLSAAQVGAGYTLYAQQKRKEAEEKKSTEKRRSRS